jgi:hypothetical protein
MSVVVALIISLITFKRQRKQQEIQNLSMQSLQRDLRALANAAVGVGGRVLELERQQRKRPTLVTNHEEPQNIMVSPVDTYASSNQPYEQAIRMTQSGANVDDIVNVCGLSRSEAELVHMMHRLDKAS